MAYQFNGSHLQVTSSPVFAFGTADYAVHIWARFESFAQVPVCWDTRTGSGSGPGVALYCDSSGKLYLFAGAVPGNVIDAGLVSTNTSYSLLVSRVSGTHRLYISGSDAGNTSTPLNLTTQGMIIGASVDLNPTTLRMNGLLAEHAVWNVGLTQADATALAKGFTPDQVRPQSLVFYAPLVRELRDLRGGLTITATNSPTVANHPRVIQ